MEERIESVNVEEIMQEIRKNIEKRGYTEKELRFADVKPEQVDGIECLDDFFELDNFRNTVVKMNVIRHVQCWRPITGNKLIVVCKKIIRKLVKFYVEPIVEDQDRFNFCTVSAMSQLYAKIQDEQNNKVEELEKRIQELEERCKQLEGNQGE